jgi:RNA polymerase sigma-70 factor (ECF subfamily)
MWGSGQQPARPDADGHAFEQLRTGLHKYLLRRLHRPEDVEDLMQEVYLRLLRFTDKDTVRSPQAYLFRVATNVLYEFRLHRSRAPVTFDSIAAAQASEHLSDEADAPDDAYLHGERQDRLRSLIGNLPPMQRAVLVMATQENLSHAQIAQRLGISASTARVHLFRAIAGLREAVGEEDRP